MYCENCLKCVIIKQKEITKYYCEIVGFECSNNIEKCNRFLARNRLNKFSEEHNS